MTSIDGWLWVASLVLTVFILIAAVQAWSLWKVRRALAALLPLEERVTRLNYSLGLLVDTTQGCFDALAAQVAQRAESAAPVARPPAGPAVAVPAVTASRPATATRQRRVVGAAKRGRTVAQIAAEEAVAEGEVALRVQMARDLQQASCELT